jgi:hypothetical protein
MKLASFTRYSPMPYFKSILLLATILLTYSIAADAQCGLSLTLTGSASICAGMDTLTLTGADTTAQIVWQNAAGNTVATINTPATDSIFVPAVGGSYIAIVTTQSGCIDTTAAIVVDSTYTPTATITASTPVLCGSMTDTFTATVSGAGAAPAYQWYLNGAIASTSDTFIASALNNNDSVWLVVTGSAACSAAPTGASNVIYIVSTTVTPTVSISANPAGSICPGRSVTFTPAPVHGGGGPSYQWYVNDSLVSNAYVYTTATLQNHDSVWVVLTSDAACVSDTQAVSNIRVVTVLTSVTPSVSITASTGDTICQNTIVDFYATAVNGGSNADYQWVVNGVNIANSLTYVANPILNGDTVTCILTSTATCATPRKDTSSAIIFTVIPYPIPAVSQSGTGNICAGDSISLLASGGDSYTWSNGDTGQIIYVSAAGTYRVTATGDYGCTAGSGPLSVSVLPVLTDTILVNGDTLTSNPSEFYQWYYNDSIIGNAITQTYVAIQSGQYQVSIIDSNGCQATSAFFDFAEAGIKNISANFDVRLYPNPNAGGFTVTFSDEVPRWVSIVDALGRTVMAATNVTQQGRFNMGTLADGVYYLHITEGQAEETVKFSVIR